MSTNATKSLALAELPETLVVDRTLELGAADRDLIRTLWIHGWNNGWESLRPIVSGLEVDDESLDRCHRHARGENDRAAMAFIDALRKLPPHARAVVALVVSDEENFPARLLDRDMDALVHKKLRGLVEWARHATRHGRSWWELC